MMRDFKFFKGQSKEMVFLPEDRHRLPLSDRWIWITEPHVTISDFDYDTGAVIDVVHNVRNYYGTFNSFIGDIIMDSRLFYIYDISLIENFQYNEIPHGTTFGEMGIYNWGSNFRILAIII